MFYGAYHEIENIQILRWKRSYNVVGNICETDTFAEDRQLPEVHEGDHLVFRNAGAIVLKCRHITIQDSNLLK
jgi:diaminopimelate decarboxylase